MNPKSLICCEPLIVPSTALEPVGIVTTLPLDIVNWSPLIESVWESVSLVK